MWVLSFFLRVPASLRFKKSAASIFRQRAPLVVRLALPLLESLDELLIPDQFLRALFGCGRQKASNSRLCKIRFGLVAVIVRQRFLGDVFHRKKLQQVSSKFHQRNASPA